MLKVVNILKNSLSDFSSPNHVRKDIWIKQFTALWDFFLFFLGFLSLSVINVWSQQYLALIGFIGAFFSTNPPFKQNLPEGSGSSVPAGWFSSSLFLLTHGRRALDAGSSRLCVSLRRNNKTTISALTLQDAGRGSSHVSGTLIAPFPEHFFGPKQTSWEWGKTGFPDWLLSPALRSGPARFFQLCVLRIWRFFPWEWRRSVPIPGLMFEVPASTAENDKL